LHARPEKEIAVFICDKHLLRGLVGFEIYQGVLAIGKIPAQWSLEKTLSTARARIFSPRWTAWAMRKHRPADAQLRGVGRAGAGRGQDVQQPVPAPRRPQFDGRDLQAAVLESSSLIKTLRELRAHGVALRCRASAHGKKSFVTDGFHRRLLHRPGQRGHGISKEVLGV